MADRKISQLTSMSSASASADLIPIVRTSSTETRKITPAKLPMSDSALARATPYTTDFISATERTRDLTTITSSSGFYFSSGLTSIHIGSNVTSIGSNAFYYCSNLTSVKIPGTCTSVGSSAFLACNSLANLVLNEGITSIGGSAFPCPITNGINIPDSVTSIGGSAFAGHQSTSVSIGSGLTSTNVNASMFRSSADTVTSMTVSADNPNIKSLDNMILTKDGTKFLAVADGVSSAPIPEGVTTIGGNAFNSTTATSITIPSTLTTLESFAFQLCQATSLPMPDTVTSVGSSAFTSSSITSYPFSSTSPLTAIPLACFNNCSGLTSASVHSGVTSIGNSAFGSSGLTSITLPNGLLSIGSNAFSYTSIASVTIPASITSIGSYAFFYNTSLSTVNILATTAPTLGSGIFGLTSSLTEIHVPVGATGYPATIDGKTVVFDL